MEAIFNQDSSYFKISLSDGTEISTDVVSFEFTEEIGMMTKGSITLYDMQDFYGSTFLNNPNFTLEFGYKTRNVNKSQAQQLSKNPKELLNTGIRTNIKCIGITPSWQYSNDGRKLFTISFYGQFFKSNLTEQTVSYQGTRTLVIQEAMTKLGVTVFNIDLGRQKKNLGANTYVRQTETTFRFLVRLAYEWHCVFQMGYNSAGLLAGMFVDQEKIGTESVASFNAALVGSVGGSKLLEYGIGSTLPNVITCNIQKHVGNSGQGDGTIINVINGQVVPTTYVTETQFVEVLILDEAELKRFIGEHQDQEKQIIKQVLGANNIDSTILDRTIRSFFKKTNFSTAPQGFGYSADIQMIGDPTLIPTIEIFFGHGFTKALQPKDKLNKFYLSKATHKMSSQGYFTNITVGDSITVNQSFIKA